MESRKRPLADSEDTVVTKKRILTGANGSPQVNGHEELGDDEDFAERLELFRKEAIYRRMKHYSREHERSQVRIQELERRKSTCEAGLAAMSACWAQLVETIRLLVAPDAIPQVNINAREIFDLTANLEREPMSDLTVALGGSVNATQALLSKFMQFNGEGQGEFRPKESYPECQKAKNECIVLRSELNLLRAKLLDCESLRDRYHTALVQAENKLERSNSGTVREVEANMRKKHPTGTREGTEELQQKPPSPVISPSIPIQVNGSHDITELATLQDQLRSREDKILELEKETALLRDGKASFELQAKAPSTEQLNETQHVKGLQLRFDQSERHLAEKVEYTAHLEAELGKLQECRQEWEEGITSISNQVIQDLRTMLSKRDVENARLREQRDQHVAELSERKQRDGFKYASLQESKRIAETNEERIKIYKLELSRLKSKLAANAGDEDLLRELLTGDSDDLDLVKRLREQKTQVETRVAALEQTLSEYQDEHPDIGQHMAVHAGVLEQLSAVKVELQKYQQTYGDLFHLPPDISSLAKQLCAKETENDRLRLLEAQFTESEKSLFTELEKLSTAWEDQDRQLKERNFNLAALEDRVTKASYEKAKSENKYFAIMREKDAIENERQKLAKTIDKQGKTIDRLNEVEKQLKSQVTTCEKESGQQKSKLATMEDRLHRLEYQNVEQSVELETERKRFNELNTLINERERGLQAKRAEIRGKEDEFIRLKKDLERQMAEAKKIARVDSNNPKTSGAEANMNKDLERVAFCSTCRSALRSTVITKCMHTFCRNCVDARLATRQRKCPHCNVAFGQADVQTFFFN